MAMQITQLNSETIYIIIVVFNRLEFTIKCLDSLANQTYKNYKVVVVDHCTANNTTFDYLNLHYPTVIVVKGDDKMWWTAANNFGIQYVFEKLSPRIDKDLFLTLNNDLTVQPDYLESLLNTYKRNKPCIVGSISVEADNPEKIDFAGCIWNQWTTRIRSNISKDTKYSELSKVEVLSTDLLPGRGTLFPVKAVQEVGMFDDVSFPHYASDYDFSYRMFKHGYKLLVSTHSIVKSEVGQTGLRFDKNSSEIPSLRLLISTQKSIRSPMNIPTRMNWAKKHSKFPLVYFTIDSLRILYAFGIYTINYIKRKK